MTTLALAAFGFLFTVSIYLAVLTGRRLRRPVDFLDAGSGIPAWALMFAGAGVLIGGLGLQDHLLLTAMYGLQYSHIALGLALSALCGAIVNKRLWIAARAMRASSPIEIVSAYYDSVAIRIALIGVTLIFALPFAAHNLALTGDLIAMATDGAIGRGQAVFTLALSLYLVSTLGGWRGIVLVIAAQSFLLLALLLFVLLFMMGAYERLAVLASGPSALKGVLADQIPGVMQYSAGIGKDVAAGGVWTTLTIVAAGGSLIGVVLSPAFGLLTTTARLRAGLAFQQVWMIAGLTTGALLIASPIIAAEIAAADPTGMAAGAPSVAGLIGRLAGLDSLAGLAFLLMLFASTQIVVAFFVSAAGVMIAGDVVGRFLVPDLDGDGRRLAARIALAALYAAVALIAAYAPLSAAIVGSVALSLSAQLLPAFIGLCWAPWISRQAVVTGLIFGALLVLFTEPPGLVAFEGRFLDLPWGRWPLTIHSTAWGLTFNVAACLLIAPFTRLGPERARREVLHGVFRQVSAAVGRASRLRTAKWSLTLIWTFFALGPGAVLGNAFFSKPMFTDNEAPLGVPSLWVWQIVFWFAAVLLTWWLAYLGRMGVVEEAAIPAIDLAPPQDLLAAGVRPNGLRSWSRASQAGSAPMTPPRAPPASNSPEKTSVDLRRLRYFVAVCDHGGFSRAAAAIGVAQPALTRQIQLLEDEVGQPLLKRTVRGARPSEAGRFLLELSRGHLAGLDDALRELRENVAAAAGPLTLGVCPSIAPFFLDDLTDHVAELYPRIALSVVEAYSGDLRSLMQAARIDLALTYSGAAPSGFPSTDLISERLVLVSGVALAPRAPASLSDVARMKLILPSRIHELRAIIDRVSLRRGVEFVPEIELDSLSAVKRLLIDEPGGWSTILPLRSVQTEAEAGLLIATAFDDPDMQRTIALVTPCEARNPTAATPVAAWIVRRAGAADPEARFTSKPSRRIQRASTANLRGSPT